MLGGGNFITQNKGLPGSYINFISAANQGAVLSSRGIAAMPMVADWGPEEQVITMKAEDFERNCLRVFGYEPAHGQVQSIREIFRNASILLFYRLNHGSVKAANEMAEAVYGGSRGNSLKLVISKSIEKDNLYKVTTVLDNKPVDTQIIKTSGEFKANGFLTLKPEAELKETAGMPLTAGTDGAGRTVEAYEMFLNKIEPYSFHALGCNTDEAEVISLFTTFTKRMREEAGRKFQTVVYRSDKADYEGIISVENKLLNVDENLYGEFSLVYWVTGAAAGCQVNKSNTNKLYNGEYEVDIDYTQNELSDGIKAGKFMLHKVGDEVRVLTDINTLITVTDEKGGDFKSNQTIRVLDQIGNDIAAIFNKKYLGIMPNDASGRISLWDSIVSYYKELAKMRAIEEITSKDITVEAGETKRSVVVNGPVTPINCMEQMYMTVVVS